MRLSWKLFFTTIPVFVIFFTLFGCWIVEVSFQSSLNQEAEQCVIENQMFQNSYELTWNGLTEEQQELLMKTCEEAGVYNNEILDSETSKALQRLEEAGVTVYTVDNPDEWLAASQSFYDEAEEKYGWSDGLVDTVKNIIGQ